MLGSGLENQSMQQYSQAQQAQQASRQGQALQSLYRENFNSIYRYVYSKVRNREVAEDLTSQVFIKAVRYYDSEHHPIGTRNWLFQVARTTVADYWRDFYRASTNSLDVLIEAGWEASARNEDEETLLACSASIEQVRRILQALSERDREVLTCRFLLGLSVRETAERMGLTEANVKTSQFRALKHAAALS